VAIKKNDVSVAMQKIVTASEEHLGGKTVVLQGKLWKSADLVKALQGAIAALHATDALHASWIKAVADEKSTYKTAILPLIKALRAYIVATFGETSQVYIDFGFPQPKPRAKPSIETNSTALQQRRATRKARNTMGKKQRLAIKGVVQPVTAQAAATSPSPAAPSTPATTPATAANVAQPNGASGSSH
jgi:hypothetical protein